MREVLSWEGGGADETESDLAGALDAGHKLPGGGDSAKGRSARFRDAENCAVRAAPEAVLGEQLRGAERCLAGRACLAAPCRERRVEILGASRGMAVSAVNDGGPGFGRGDASNGVGVETGQLQRTPPCTEDAEEARTGAFTASSETIVGVDECIKKNGADGRLTEIIVGAVNEANAIPQRLPSMVDEARS